LTLFFNLGHDGKKYVALMDTQAVSDSSRPRYRCALFEEDEYSGEIKFALSSDSTCTNHLRSPIEGYETLALKPIAHKPWPSHFTEFCELPDWAQGKWEHLHVQGGTVLLKDHRNFKTYTARCIPKRIIQQSQPNEERFLIYARTQCGDEHYKCVWFKSRGINAMEFQVGKHMFNKNILFCKNTVSVEGPFSVKCSLSDKSSFFGQSSFLGQKFIFRPKVHFSAKSSFFGIKFTCHRNVLSFR
jgi:hypothetical protein